MNINESVNIIMASDDNFAPHLGVCILSILESRKKDYEILFYIFNDNISENNIIKVQQIINSYKKCSIKLININNNLFKNLPLIGHIKIATYYRIIAPQIINKNRLLYIDCDTIILKDIYDLYTINLENKIIAAVSDINEKNIKKNFFRKIDQYFNAGVMLINATKWKENHITKNIFDFVNNVDNLKKIKYLDQDFLNHALDNKWLELENKYNHQIEEYNKKFIINNIYILHYIGENKPWHFFYTNPLKSYYLHHLSKSPWKDFFSEDKPRIKKISKQISHNLILLIKKYTNSNIINILIKFKHTISRIKKYF